jgi:hypothetical protein
MTAGQVRTGGCLAGLYIDENTPFSASTTTRPPPQASRVTTGFGHHG